ncbi:ribonuclease HII [Oscillatoria sp. FACHB-1407]|uniref:ribonuclease HII n=1 Tax=Oscillatoria sp. FACHB-1407 TaxID=2692847 RepID=UPI0016886482|nr:ribonuclease HII [Oscillatoria sp. FACHB-1407]MBD2465312.1 ribonuclease HII [Oscillatoria sp. FACHB-1407]
MVPQQLSLLEASQLPSASIVAGVDEVGRGALFGPVVAAAVILPSGATTDLIAAGVTDSKQLTAMQRVALVSVIRAIALDCKIGVASVREIDRLNILQASLLAMRRSILRLDPAPELCLIDGNQRVPHLPMPQQTIIKGDQHSVAIAAASIIAKVWRDELMTRLAKRYPGYDLDTNKGYGTVKHRQVLHQLGVTLYHRRSFSPCRLPGNDTNQSVSDAKQLDNGAVCG